jgi:NuA3 HAT complex component NTO1
MPIKPNEVKDPVVTKSRRAKNTARKASDLHCKKLSDVISGMLFEVQAEVPKTFEQASDVHSKLSDVVSGMQSEVQAEVPNTFEQAIDVQSKLSDVVNGMHQAEVLKALEQSSDVHCKKLPNVVNGKHSEVQDEVLKTLEQVTDVHCNKFSNVVHGTHSEVQDEVLKTSEQASDVLCKKLSNVFIGKHSEVQDEVLKTLEQASDRNCKKFPSVVSGKHSEVQEEVLQRFDHAIDPEVAAPAREEEPRKEDDAAGEPKQDCLVEEEEDDGVLCAVCRSTDGDPSDPIVFCDGCDLMVHATCYGNPLAESIPDGDWFCSLCSNKATAAAGKKGKPARPPCRLCPARGGAMKRTTDGAWAHISCALLVPEVFFQDPDGRDAIDCSLVPARRFTNHCYICESSRGCALECSQPKCDLGFHVSCGLNGGLCIEYREEKGIVVGFCREHTKLWEKVKFCISLLV